MFTPLHRYLGEEPGPLTEAMLDGAVAQGVAEAADLDWKARLPAEKGLPASDLPKDLAAMANSGGGLLVFGVTETAKRASGREDAGEMSESYERTLRRAAYTAIRPPLTGLHIERIAGENAPAVAILVPDSPDAPHLVFSNQYFGAPIRNDSDTEWMNETALEAAYKMRFNSSANSDAELESLYGECVRAHDPASAATLIAVARPRHHRAASDRPRTHVAELVNAALHLAYRWTAPKHAYNRAESAAHLLDGLDVYAPRTGLRRWTAEMRRLDGELAAHAALHHDGAVTVGWSVGGGASDSSTDYPQWEVSSGQIESFIADTLALIQAVSAAQPSGDVEILVGLEWHGDGILTCRENTPYGRTRGSSTAFGKHFAPVRAVVRPADSDEAYYDDVRAIATDCVAQFGISQLSILLEPPLPPLPR